MLLQKLKASLRVAILHAISDRCLSGSNASVCAMCVESQRVFEQMRMEAQEVVDYS